jgi:MFS family permease
MSGLTLNYITPFALTMKATTAQIGLLSSIPNFTMSLVQLAAPGLSERAGSRKDFILPVVFLHALMWLPILLTPYLFHSNQVWWLILFQTLGTAFDSMSNPPWGSMMADLVLEGVRGRFFGNRNRIMGLVSMVFSYVAGGILQPSGNQQRFILHKYRQIYRLLFLHQPDDANSRTLFHSLYASRT